LASLRGKLGIRVNCICLGWVETPTIQRELVRMTQEERAALEYPPPVLIQPNEIADAVIMFIRDDALAGRVMIWPDGEP
jgi:NAD(P)-dependent dehydrogenase (short-subunit alcohol dehydrogenase family)